MPLARYALVAWGAQIHVAPTWDRGEFLVVDDASRRQGRTRSCHRVLPGRPQGRFVL